MSRWTVVEQAGQEDWRTVVGVVGDVGQHDLTGRRPQGVAGTMYMAYPQSVTTARRLPAAMTLLLRTEGPPAGVSREVRDLMRRLDPDVPVGAVRPLAAVVSSSVAPSRSLVWLFGAFGGSALLLAAVGIFGVVSHATAQRTYEIGVGGLVVVTALLAGLLPARRAAGVDPLAALRAD